MNKKILWLKWEDPFEIKKKDLDEENQFQDNIEEEKHLRVIAGPYGMIPVNENSITNKLYKMWVGHCNFDITKEISDKIEKISGVEVLRIWTRYRFWLGIGNLFNDDDVQKQIEKSIFPKKINKNISIETLAKVLEKKYGYWIIYSIYNEELKTFGSDKKDDVINTINKTKNIILILCSWENIDD